MKVVAFGSCYSRFVAINLRQNFGFEHINNVYHITSEQFVKYYINKSAPQIDLHELESLFVPGEKPDDLKYARGMLRNQYAEHMGIWEFPADEMSQKRPFLENIESEEIDVILLDNFTDLSTKPQYFIDNEKYKNSPIQFVDHFYKNKDDLSKMFSYADFIDPESSARYWSDIIRWINLKQPNVKIYFLAFFACTSNKNPERQKRALEFASLLERFCAEQPVYIIPPLNVPDNFLVEGDWTHVDASVYRAIAGHIYLQAITGFPKRPRH